ncbi:uncharacterized protein LOC125957419 [Anopheles darlingi]|uniref:uncharacterized protein LOC125957419 n=1 Tax=Anopheles darlingi TaxID=43151 RepID=UPI00210006E8|nr:uncharacterized protein LOC125957419 [Anopheles darlingi]
MASGRREAKVPKNLTQLSIEEKTQFLNSFDMVQTDCDGVLWNIKDIFPGGELSIRALRNNGKRVIYVSNNSVRTMEDYRNKLGRLTDYTLDEDDVVHPARTIVEYLRWRKFDALCYVIGSTNFKNYIREAGFRIIDGPDVPIEGLRDAIAQINDQQPVKAVIVDFDHNCNNLQLQRAQLYLQRCNDCWFIAGAMDKVLPVGPRMRLIGSGFYVEMLQQLADRKPIVLGKPGLEMSKVIKRLYSIEDSRRVLFVGDQPGSDVKFGSISGFQTLLVGTGGVRPEHLLAEGQDRDEETVPDYYIPTFADLAQVVLDVQTNVAKSVL